MHIRRSGQGLIGRLSVRDNVNRVSHSNISHICPCNICHICHCHIDIDWMIRFVVMIRFVGFVLDVVGFVVITIIRLIASVVVRLWSILVLVYEFSIVENRG